MAPSVRDSATARPQGRPDTAGGRDQGSRSGPAARARRSAERESLSDRRFPPGFVFGVATSAFQIEGATQEDGRGTSIWDTFARTPGSVISGELGDPACDHYHRWEQDLDLMGWIGVNAYRFSLSWPRWQPTGRGRIESRGAAFYDRLVDGLLERDIQPWATLYHWDLPQALEDAGGWGERDTAYRFADYARAVRETLGDRLTGLITLNEPWCSAMLGYACGHHAPGMADKHVAVRSIHHLLLAHGLAASEWVKESPVPVGITLNLYPVAAVSQDAADLDAARRVDGLMNRMYLDPVLRGAYPGDVLADLGEFWDDALVRDDDLDRISTPLNFLGVNYYSSHLVAAVPGASADESPGGVAAVVAGTPARYSPWVGSPDVDFVSRGLPQTDMEWEIEPDGLRRMLTRLADDYECPPVYITENGAAFPDELASGEVADTDRVEFLDGHLSSLLEAVQQGVDVRGYFLWSLLDNFEWAWGTTKRFGLIHVDFATQARTPKASAHWYQSVIKSKSLPPQKA